MSSLEIVSKIRELKELEELIEELDHLTGLQSVKEQINTSRKEADEYINNYLEISNTISDKNGILYLDYGNYFVPKE